MFLPKFIFVCLFCTSLPQLAEFELHDLQKWNRQHSWSHVFTIYWDWPSPLPFSKEKKKKLWYKAEWNTIKEEQIKNSTEKYSKEWSYQIGVTIRSVLEVITFKCSFEWNVNRWKCLKKSQESLLRGERAGLRDNVLKFTLPSW